MHEALLVGAVVCLAAALVALVAFCCLLAARLVGRPVRQRPRPEPAPAPVSAPASAPAQMPASAPAPVAAPASALPAAAVPRAPLVIVRSHPPRLTRHPIVLAHGLFGFDAIALPGARCDYFRGVPERLRALGTELYVLRVPPVASVRVRAARLAEQVRRLPADRVTVIAHSMGGLDARYAISSLGLHDRVACLVTVGTPHRGTPLADLLERFVPLRAPAFLDALGPIGPIRELLPARMEAYNRVISDAPEVRYASVVGAAVQVTPLLQPAHRFLARHGPSDGLVPVASQRWGEVLGELDFDHWAQIGWSRSFDVAGFYAQLVERLAEQGL